MVIEPEEFKNHGPDALRSKFLLYYEKYQLTFKYVFNFYLKCLI